MHCIDCGKAFLKAKYLNQHKQKGRCARIECVVCGQVFQRNKLRRMHKCKGSVKPFVCIFCGKRYATKHSLSGHMKRQHNNAPSEGTAAVEDGWEELPTKDEAGTAAVEDGWEGLPIKDEAGTAAVEDGWEGLPIKDEAGTAAIEEGWEGLPTIDEAGTAAVDYGSFTGFSDGVVEVSADIKLETENEDGSNAEDLSVECCNSQNIYHPKIALRNAKRECLTEFLIPKEPFGHITKPQPQVTMATTSTTTKTVAVPEVNTTQLQALADVCSTVNSSAMNTISNPVKNSLVSPTKVVMNDDIQIPMPNIASNIELPKKIPISIVPVPIIGNAKNLGVENHTYAIAMESTSTMEQGIKNDSQEMLNLKSEEKVEEDAATLVLEDEDIRIDEKPQQLEVENAILPIETDWNSSSPVEAMECSNLNSQIPPREQSKAEDDVMMAETGSVQESLMQVESAEPSPLSNSERMKDVECPIAAAPNDSSITTSSSDNQEQLRIGVADLNLLCDLIYLPFEHGPQATKYVNEFNWLKANAHVLLTSHAGSKKANGMGSSAKPEIAEWLERADRFNDLCENVQTLMKKIANCANKEICHDLYTYVWDVAGTLMILNAFVKWLNVGHFPHNTYTFPQGTYTWFSKGWNEASMSGDQEPSVIHGGLTADLQRLMPVDSGNDLFLSKLPEKPLTECYNIRPFRYTDEEAVYNVCMRTFMQFNIPEHQTELPTQLRDLIANHVIGPFLTLSPELFVVANESRSDNEIVAYAAAAFDVKAFVRNSIIGWLPKIREKYSPTTLNGIFAGFKSNTNDFNDFIQALIKDFQDDEYQCPLEISATYPAVLQLAILSDVLLKDEGLLRRLLTVTLAALRLNGCVGVHVRLRNTKRLTEEMLFYNRVGFAEFFRNDRFVYVGRRF